MKLIFRTDLFVKDTLSKGIYKKSVQVKGEFEIAKLILDANEPWLVDCEGKEVIHGLIGNYAIKEEWCEKIEE